MEILSNIKYGVATRWTGIMLHIPYVKYSFLFYTVWGDLNDSSVNEHYLFGVRIK